VSHVTVAEAWYVIRRRHFHRQSGNQSVNLACQVICRETSLDISPLTRQASWQLRTSGRSMLQLDASAGSHALHMRPRDSQPTKQ